MFRNYWQEYSTAYKQFSRGGTDTYNYTWPGDVVSLLNNNGLAYHTLICTLSLAVHKLLPVLAILVLLPEI